MPKTTAAAAKDGGSIEFRVQAMRKQADYNTITSYFGRNRGPKIKYANKKRKHENLMWLGTMIL